MAGRQRIIRPLSPQEILRFWEKVRIRGPDDCWEWQACRSRKGYGKFGLDRDCFEAPRVAWTIAHGPIPPDLCVLHHCDNPPCCNPGPGHLFLGTHADNMADMRRKRRHSHGMKAPNAKMSDLAIASLREEYASGDYTQRELARRYGISQSVVSGIINHKRWSHV